MVGNKMDALEWLRKQLMEADPGLLQDMVKVFTETVMSAEADVLCGADYGQRSEERVNRRNGYRERAWDNPHRHDRSCGAEASGRQLLPGLVARAPSSG